jgi:hypothetical protein
LTNWVQLIDQYTKFLLDSEDKEELEMILLNMLKTTTSLNLGDESARRQLISLLSK